MRSAIQPVRVELARAGHESSASIFNNPTLSALSEKYRWHLYLELQVSAFQLAVLGVAGTYYPRDTLLRLISNLKLKIPGIFATQDALTGEDWAIFWKIFGVNGRYPTNYAADEEIISAATTDYATFLRVPLWVPDPFASGYERCGLHPKHVAAMKFSLRTGASTLASIGTTTLGDITGEWVIVAEGYRASNVILPPKMHFEKTTLPAGQFTGFDTIKKDGETESSMMLRVLAAWATASADPSGAGIAMVKGNLPKNEIDLVQIDGVQLTDNEETIGMAASRLAHNLRNNGPGDTTYAGEGIVTYASAFPILLAARQSVFGDKPSVHYYQSPFGDLGDAVKAKSTFNVKPQTAREVYAISYQAHSDATLAEHRKIGLPATDGVFLLKNGMEAAYNPSARSILPLKLY